MSYKIDLGQWGSVFAVPSSVVDKHIKIASEAQLKVLLYLLRCSDDEITDEVLSTALGISAEEAANAVSFWIERGLISKENSNLYPAVTAENDIAVKTAEHNDIPTEKKPEKRRTAPSRAQRPDFSYVSKLLEEDKCLSGFMEDVQNALKKPLSSGDMCMLVMLCTTFGLPYEVIAMLINYLAEAGQANMRNIERIAIQWSDDGINTAEAAEAEIERLINSSNAWGRVSSLLGIKNIGKPTKSQKEHAYRWLHTWGFNDEMITEAYERCVNTKGEYNIRYINAILQKWFERGIRSLDSLKEAEAASNKRSAVKKPASSKGSVFSVEGASFDVSKYENNSLFDD